MKHTRDWVPSTLLGIGLVMFLVGETFAQQIDSDPTHRKSYRLPPLNVGPGDWPQWSGSSLRNNTPQGRNIPTEWDVQEGKNIKWKAKLGSQTYCTPVVANGKVFVGTNNDRSSKYGDKRVDGGQRQSLRRDQQRRRLHRTFSK